MTRDLPGKIDPILGDDRAVSPVVGVALLIAITVILAAVIGFVVLDTTVATTESKEVRVTFEQVDDNTAKVIHEGGDNIPADQIRIRINDRDGNTKFFKLLSNNNQFPNTGDRFNTGTEFTVPIGNGPAPYTIFIVWEDPDSNREIQIAKGTVG